MQQIWYASIYIKSWPELNLDTQLTGYHLGHSYNGVTRLKMSWSLISWMVMFCRIMQPRNQSIITMLLAAGNFSSHNFPYFYVIPIALPFFRKFKLRNPRTLGGCFPENFHPYKTNFSLSTASFSAKKQFTLQ